MPTLRFKAFCFVFGAYNLSLIQSAQVFFLGGGVLRILVSDLFTISFISLLVAEAKKRNVAHSPHLFVVVVGLVGLAVFASCIGLVNNPTNSVLRELRIWMVFIGLFYSFCLAMSAESGQIIIKWVAYGSVAGSFIYIMVGSALFPSVEVFREYQSIYGEAGAESFRMAISQKFKVAPYMLCVALLVCTQQLFSPSSRARDVLLGGMILACVVYVALQSNMRSALVAVVLSGVAFFTLRTFSSATALKIIVGFVGLILLGLLAILSYGEVLSESLVNDRFYEQILEKGIFSKDFSNRLYALDYALEQAVQGGAGLGLGAASSFGEGVLWEVRVHPVDSLVLYMSMTFGFLSMPILGVAVLVYILTLCAYLLTLIKRSSFESESWVGFLAVVSLSVWMLNGFNDSPFVYIPDVGASALVFSLCFVYLFKKWERNYA